MSKNPVKYSCRTETEKPKILLASAPSKACYLAVEHPDDWGFDPSLKEYQHSSQKWLDDAVTEHNKMVETVKGQGIEVLYVEHLLGQREAECRDYVSREFKKTEARIEGFGRKIENAIHASYEKMLESPVDGLLLGLEAGKSFEKLSYETKLKVYRSIKTLMPQNSLYFTQDPVISTPSGLVKSKMAMWDRKQEPDILQLALGKENYMHELKNTTEGGDVTMFSYVHGGDIFFADSIMLLGISALSGRGIEKEAENLKDKAKLNLVKFYVPDFFDQSLQYAGGNVMHLDTLFMPLSDIALLGNRRMMKETAVREHGKPIRDAYSWAQGKFERFVEVPDDEHLKWGANVLPVGDNTVISSEHLTKTNSNLEKAGITVIAIPNPTLTSGYGSIHCMVAHIG